MRQALVGPFGVEKPAEEAGTATWRGHVTHVPSGERRYLKRLEDIVEFVRPYLARMGIKPAPPWADCWRRRKL